MNPNPRVGVGVFVFNHEGTKFVLGKRKGSHGAGTWALPGGHLEFGESFETCAAREVLEETGLVVRDLHFLTATNDIMEAEGKHYVTIFIGCTVVEGNAQPQVLEPEKCEEWQWVTWEEVRSWFDAHMTRIDDGAGENTGNGRQLFIPLLDLFRQRPGFHPSRR